MIGKLLMGNITPQLVKYAAAGLAGATLEYAIFFILYRTAGLWYISSNLAAMAAGFLASFILNRTFTFRSKGNIHRQFVLYTSLFAVNLGISSLFMLFFSNVMRVIPLMSKLIVMGLVALWNYIAYKKIIFKD